ncbi:hypothetical protein MRB53_031953 [Persea americana]|uniref:Uncharacterized protein n=1 Tax=Persea americana TaxID=3435 RepID=A0ACC2KQG6_PERAE|nr:hypothetical protein MRB53_031953 [Persea americana]
METPNPTLQGIFNKRRNESKWIAESQQRRYSSKLLEALRLVRRKKPPAPSRALREASDRALAVAARGRSRWSRAILSSRRGLSIHKNKKRAVTGCSRLGKRADGLFRSRGKRFAGLEVERRRRVLGRLVPGQSHERSHGAACSISDQISTVHDLIFYFLIHEIGCCRRKAQACGIDVIVLFVRFSGQYHQMAPASCDLHQYGGPSSSLHGFRDHYKCKFMISSIAQM